MAVAVLAGCDKDADNAKMIKVSGGYIGAVEASLCMPDYAVEEVNAILNDNGNTSVAADTVKNTSLQLNFASDNLATFSMTNFKGMKFSVPFLTYDEDEGYIAILHYYTAGSLAKLVYAVTSHYDPNTPDGDPAKNLMSKAELFKFLEIISYLKDEINFENIKIKPVPIMERGTYLSTYDEEQNSFYVKTYLEDFTYERKTNLTDAIEYIDANLKKYLTTEEVAIFDNIKQKLVLKGTVSDATGWCCLSYSNYLPNISLTINKATGILDVLTNLLYGPYKINYDGNVMNDKNGNPVPSQSLILEIDYQGTFENIDSFELIED